MNVWRKLCGVMSGKPFLFINPLSQGLSEIGLFHGRIGIALCYADSLLLGLFCRRPKIKRTDEIVDDFDFPRLGVLVYRRHVNSVDKLP